MKYVVVLWLAMISVSARAWDVPRAPREAIAKTHTEPAAPAAPKVAVPETRPIAPPAPKKYEGSGKLEVHELTENQEWEIEFLFGECRLSPNQDGKSSVLILVMSAKYDPKKGQDKMSLYLPGFSPEKRTYSMQGRYGPFSGDNLSFDLLLGVGSNDKSVFIPDGNALDRATSFIQLSDLKVEGDTLSGKVRGRRLKGLRDRDGYDGKPTPYVDISGSFTCKVHDK
jgi:hypothetical protein